MPVSTPTYLDLWGKTGRSAGADRVHPLIAHLIDVGEVAASIIEFRASQQTRDRLDRVFTDPVVGFRFLAAMHDIGKATPLFQGQQRELAKRLRDRGLVFPKGSSSTFHGPIAGVVGADLCATVVPGWDSRITQFLLNLAGAHHGTKPLTSRRSRQLKTDLGVMGDAAWVEARLALVKKLVELWGPPGGLHRMPDHGESVLMGGWIVAADWIGSNTQWFPPVGPLSVNDLPAYRHNSMQNAHAALTEIGLVRWAPKRRLLWAQGFPEIVSPRPLQEHAIGVADRLDGPSMVVIEADTGEGKTEAALHIAQRLVEVTGASGFYVALPTRATADSMHQRVERFVKVASADAGAAGPVGLVHSSASIVLESRGPVFAAASIGVDAAEGPNFGSAAANSWFNEGSKRGLLHPVAVGTIDQLIIAAQPAKHWWLRMAALSQSVLIIDEAHAFDTYQQTVLEALLEWAGHLGVSVVVLSATLPSVTRDRLVECWRMGAGVGGGVGAGPAYPAITAVSAGKVHHLPFASARSRVSRVETLVPDDVTVRAAQWAAEGRSVLIVHNTVSRAQETYRDLRLMLDSEIPVVCYHSRFPAARRTEIHGHVEALWGTGQRHRPGVCVATQVLEQSIDVSFDVLISDGCPIDLLIQRRGRTRRDLGADYSSAGDDIVYVVWDDDPGSLDRASAGIYGRWLLYKTRFRLEETGVIDTPAMVRQDIDAVYNSDMPQGVPAGLGDVLSEALSEHETQMSMYAADAAAQALPSASTGASILELIGSSLADENSDSLFRARSRLGAPQVEAVMVWDDGAGGLFGDAALSVPVDVEKPSDCRVELLRNRCPVRQHHAAGLSRPLSWERDSVFQHYQLLTVYPDGRTSHPSIVYGSELGCQDQ